MKNTTKRTAIKLPKGLPPIPPVPAGYDAWEYMGNSWDTKGQPTGCPWSSAFIGHAYDKHWGIGIPFVPYPAHLDCYPSDQHYIRAIKHPAPKPAAKGRKAVKAIRFFCRGARWRLYKTKKHANEHNGYMPMKIKPVAALDVSDEAALIEQGCDALMTAWNTPLTDKESRTAYRHDARVILESLGLIAKRKKGAK